MSQFTALVAFLTARINVARDEAHERGATATEYAMLVAFIAVAIAAAVTLFGGKLKTFFTGLSTSIGIG